MKRIIYIIIYCMIMTSVFSCDKEESNPEKEISATSASTNDQKDSSQTEADSLYQTEETDSSSSNICRKLSYFNYHDADSLFKNKIYYVYYRQNGVADEGDVYSNGDTVQWTFCFTEDSLHSSMNYVDKSYKESPESYSIHYKIKYGVKDYSSNVAWNDIIIYYNDGSNSTYNIGRSDKDNDGCYNWRLWHEDGIGTRIDAYYFSKRKIK